MFGNARMLLRKYISGFSAAIRGFFRGASRMNRQMPDDWFGDFESDSGGLVKAIYEGRAIMTMQGIDVNGQAFAQLAASTLRTRKGSGPPLAPDGLGSRIYSSLAVTEKRGGLGELIYELNWGDFEGILAINAKGGINLPVRDTLGMSPTAMTPVLEEIARISSKKPRAKFEAKAIHKDIQIKGS